MTGYSGTPLAKKLGIKPGHRLALVDAPDGWAVPDLPNDVTAGPPEGADVVVAFHRAAAELAANIEALGQAIYPDGMVWIAWPRKAGGHDSDITENGIRDVVLPLGLVDVKVAALDNDWSGLKVVWRRERR
ncbi:MAG TPA: DUF3052 domain-containing protein [Solirubrobacteraceae bacterium]|nr:DUF3052 domain-containing protein [Solirubrobacteraceae bacterium]